MKFGFFSCKILSAEANFNGSDRRINPISLLSWWVWRLSSKTTTITHALSSGLVWIRCQKYLHFTLRHGHVQTPEHHVVLVVRLYGVSNHDCHLFGLRLWSSRRRSQRNVLHGDRVLVITILPNSAPPATRDYNSIVIVIVITIIL